MFGDVVSDGEPGPDVLVLHFPVEIEVRTVAPHDQEDIVSATLDRLTEALQGLA